MSFGEAISSGFSRYVDFHGRSSRSEYWWWVLFVVLVSIGLNVLLGIAGAAESGGLLLVAGVLSLIFFLGTALPGIAVSVRRLHDVGRSGWWYLLVMIPIIGAIILLIWFCQPGQSGPNDWGTTEPDAAFA